MNAMMRLRAKYPDLFDKKYFHDLPDGWEWIVEAFIDSAKQWRWMENDEYFTNFSFLTITQCKEKFGTLRLYIDVYGETKQDINHISAELHGAKNMAELLSARTCACCGTMNNAKNRDNNGYYLTLCDQCVETGAWKL